MTFWASAKVYIILMVHELFRASCHDMIPGNKGSIYVSILTIVPYNLLQNLRTGYGNII